MHRARAILQAIAGALVALEPGVRISTGRVYPVGLEGLPAVNIRAGDEASDPDQDSGGPDYTYQVRQFDIDLEVWATAEADIDAAALDLSLEIERILGPRPTPLDTLTDMFRYLGSGEPERTGEMESPVIARVLTYRAQYRVDTADPI